ncbi:LacI family transcriptional regulator [Leifsonia sp. Leaf264]|nr:LacI family transcriptional regulator [Leifsonia sp. Leaf264]
MTTADIARSLGISRATVGFVLNDTPGQTISAGTRDRVLSEAKRLGYRPNGAARALASGHSRVILLVLPDWPLDYSMRANLDEASLALDEAGYSLVTMTPHPGGHAQPLWETLRPDVVMGMMPFTPEQLTQIRDSGVTHVIPETPAGEPNSDEQLGYTGGPRIQVAHLADRGRRRLAFAGSTDPRLRELVEQRRGLTRDSAVDLLGAPLTADQDIDEESVSRVLADWITAGVDGVIAYNDDVAALITGAALRAGVDVPAELAVIGHDDTPLARLFVPALSSVRIDSAGLGRYLAQLALSAALGSPPPAAGPETEAVLVARETT